MRPILLLAALAGLGWYAWTQHLGPPAGFGVGNEADASRPIVVKIHADYCGTCQALSGTWSRLEAMGDARMVVLDVTNEERFGETVRIARYMGISDFLDQNMEATGTIGVLDGSTRAPVAVFHGERNVSRYLGAIDAARR